MSTKSSEHLANIMTYFFALLRYGYVSNIKKISLLIEIRVLFFSCVVFIYNFELLRMLDPILLARRKKKWRSKCSAKYGFIDLYTISTSYKDVLVKKVNTSELYFLINGLCFCRFTIYVGLNEKVVCDYVYSK